jgi:hypothetical protein
VIGGVVLSDGGSRLARHLANVDDNEIVEVRTPTTLATDLRDALGELRLMAVGCRTRTPFVHAWASPRLDYDDQAWDRYWLSFEQEFRLLGRPYVEVQHLKLSRGGRIEPHRHRVYLRLDEARRAIPMSYSGLRIQKLSRVAEFENGEPFTAGVSHRSVVRHLRADGRLDVADAMEKAQLGSQRPKPAPTSAERAAADRTNDFATDEIWRRAYQAWSTTATGAEFRDALATLELTLALGDKAPVMMSPAGNPIPLRRAISNGAKLGGGAPVRKYEVDARLSGLKLEPWTAIGKRSEFDPGPAGQIRRDRTRRRQLARRSPDVLTRRPIFVRDTPPLAPASGLSSPRETSPLPELTPRQLKQLREMADTSAEIEALVEIENAPKRRSAKLRAQRRAARAALEAHRASRKSGPDLGLRSQIGASSIARSGFDVAAYKTKLAGVDDDIGALLRWVEVGRDRKALHLWNGVVVVTSSEAAIASEASVVAIRVMLAHAAAQAWDKVTISSGDAAWREKAARSATRAGFDVVDHDLREIVEDERRNLSAAALPDAPNVLDPTPW